MMHDITADDGTEDYYKSYDDEHVAETGWRLEGSVVTTVADRWLQLHDDLLSGLSHSFSNGLATVSAASGILASALTDGRAVDNRFLGGLLKSTDDLERVLHALRLLAVRRDAAVQPVLVEDVTDMARGLLVYHPLHRGSVVSLEIIGTIVPIMADPGTMAHVLLLLLVFAADMQHDRNPAQLVLRAEIADDEVILSAPVLAGGVRTTPVRSMEDCASINWLLAGGMEARGYAEVGPKGCRVYVPVFHKHRGRQKGQDGDGRGGGHQSA